MIVLKRKGNSWEKTESVILDLADDNDGYKWISSKLPLDKHPTNGTKMVLANNGYLHFINAWKSVSRHFKIHLSAFLPSDLYKKYSNYGN